MYMDDIKIFVKNRKELETLIRAQSAWDVEYTDCISAEE